MVKHIDEQIGQRIQKRRLAIGKTQEKLAQEVGIGVAELQAFESGDARASAANLFAISDKLDTEVTEFFYEISQETSDEVKADLEPASDELADIRARLRVFVLCRYSYVGKSDWRAKASKDPAKLLDEGRLARRLELFGKLPLPSLATQTDLEFHLVLLISDAMPQAARADLTKLVKEVLGERVTLLARPPRRAGKMFRKFIVDSSDPGDLTVQVNLDDDDALATDYIENLKAAAARAWAERGELPYRIISYTHGISAVIGGDEPPQFFRRHSPANMQGLAVVSEAARTRPVLHFMSHARIPARHTNALVQIDTGLEKPMYVRGVHGGNDSRARVSAHPITPEELDRMECRLPSISLLKRKRNSNDE